MKLNRLLASTTLTVAMLTGASAQAAPQPSPQPKVSHHFVEVQGVKIFYREAGDPAKPTVLLMHGFPTSSFMYRELIPKLADRYHVVAPDMPGFGFSDSPDRAHYAYTFDNLAKTMDGFTEALSLKRYALEVFDYGAPVGWRMAVAHPERISAIITQNGNAYEEGLSSGWSPIQRYWNDPSQANRDALRDFLSAPSIKWQYTQGVKDPDRVAPEAYTLDAAFVARPGNDEIQLDLFKDYANNVKRYPEFQAYFRKHQPPLLAVWGEHDPFFLPPGATAFKRDIAKAQVYFYDTGHFALETHVDEIGDQIHRFLDANVTP
ncbi:alpha/beta hydrolase [Pseudomonas sp. GD03842]|uniref:alpha/beta fold hydrolase n=1 Tax=Pseudomonas sp. GD03842 TaxID=2975385 RepID=UPI00244B8E01|nr:alpha/beta hydrolase [Pseudomonas sp. GD03842]MDH0747025.1 alpha/beta hydrolase [Pseudomonas sp. GD03842]